MAFSLGVSNPSPYPRRGIVEVRLNDLWKVPGSHRDNPIVKDSNGRTLDCQIVELDPESPFLSSLIIELQQPVRPGGEHYDTIGEYLTLSLSTPGRATRAPSFMGVDLAPDGSHVRLYNKRLDLLLQLATSLPGQSVDSLGGAVLNLRLKSGPVPGNVLFGFPDFFYSPEGYPEIRCLQIDKLFVKDDETDSVQQIDLFDSDYDVVKVHSGPVRVGVTIASKKMCEVSRRTSSGRIHYLRCRFFRALSVDRESDFVLERTWLRPCESGYSPDLLPFRARYFAFLKWSFEMETLQIDGQRDWLVVKSKSPKETEKTGDRPRRPCYPALGFATDLHTVRFRTPHPYYPNPDWNCHSVVWETAAVEASVANCLHRFYILPSGDHSAHLTGEAWYEILFKPLRCILFGAKA